MFIITYTNDMGEVSTMIKLFIFIEKIVKVKK